MGSPSGGHVCDSEACVFKGRRSGGSCGTTVAPHPWMRKNALHILVGAFVLATLYVSMPLAASLILGAWAAQIARPLFGRLERHLRGRRTAAAIVTGALIVALAAPFALAVTSLIPAARSLIDQLRRAPRGKDVLAALVSGGGAAEGGGVDIVGLAREYGASASRALGAIASTSADVIIGAFVFVVVFFALLVDGDRAYAWLRENSPLDASVLDRMARAFTQAGRGLLIGTGLTALAQGIVAGIIYAALGVPRALLLGMLSVIGALIPVTGTAIVWIPVAAGLVLTGRPGKAALLAVLSVVLVGTVDNLLRPWLARRADVGLPAVVVLVAIFGGLATLGPWGLLFGPLVVRLTVEALDIVRHNARAST